MRKILTILGSILLGSLLTVLAFGTFSYVRAQAPTPQPGYPYGGMMGNGYRGGGMHGYGNQGGYGGPGMMGAYAGSGEYGPMHEYMEEAFAKALNITENEIETRLSNGETMFQIAQSQGLSQEKIADLFGQVRNEALQKAVDAGAITQDQADWMLNRMGGRFGGGCWGRSSGPSTYQYFSYPFNKHYLTGGSAGSNFK